MINELFTIVLWQSVLRIRITLAEESKTGKQGSWTIYNPEATTAVLWTYSWSISASNTFTANLTFSEEGGAPSTFDTISNANKSGSFIYKAGGVKEAEIIWTSSGTGTYWIKDGDAAITGSW